MNCERCNKCFQTKWQLNRHLSRKNKCKIELKVANDDIDSVKSKVDLLENRVEETNTKLNQLADHIGDNYDHTIQCRYCNKRFNHQTNYTKHLKVCKSKVDNICIYERELNIVPSKPGKLQCRFCEKKFSKLQGYSRHITTWCKEKIIYEKELEQKVLERRCRAAEQQIYTTSTEIHGNQNNTFNIVLPTMNAFGNENIDYLTTKFLKKELEKLNIQKTDITSFIEKFTKLIHANPAHPENHNVVFKSLNSGYAEVYDGIEYNSKPSSDIQDQIIQRVGVLVGPVADQSVHTDLGKVLEEMDDVMYEATEDKDDGKVSRTWSQCRQAVKGTLFSNKDYIQSTKSLIES